MAVPKKKVSSARRDKRRSNNSKLTLPGMVKCSNPACGETIRPTAFARFAVTTTVRRF